MFRITRWNSWKIKKMLWINHDKSGYWGIVSEQLFQCVFSCLVIMHKSNVKIIIKAACTWVYLYKSFSAKNEGIAIGISARAALWAAVQVAKRSENKDKKYSCNYSGFGRKVFRKPCRIISAGYRTSIACDFSVLIKYSFFAYAGRYGIHTDQMKE